MKDNQINKLINETLKETAKEVIIEQQKDSLKKTMPILGRECFKNKIKKFEPFFKSNNSMSLDIEINDVDKEEAFKCYNVNDLNELQKIISIGLHNNLEKTRENEHYDVDVDISEENNKINFKINIITNKMLGEDMKNKNLFQQLVEAKRKKKKTFLYEGKKVNVDNTWDKIKTNLKNASDDNDEEECSECGDKKVKEIKEKDEKVLKMNESELLSIIKSIIKEAEGIPGISVTKDNKNAVKKDNDDYLNSVDKKMKEYLNFENNDNPEFPGQIGTGEVKAHKNTEDDNEYVDNNRGGNNLDLDYDAEPSKEFVDRVKKALTGDSTMGNSSKDTINTTETKTGDEMQKKSEKKKEAEKDYPMYKKDKQPIKETKKKDKQPIKETNKDLKETHKKTKKGRIDFILKNDKKAKKEELEKLSNEEIEKKYNQLEKKMGLIKEKKEDKIVLEDIKRMKNIFNYNKKTQ